MGSGTWEEGNVKGKRRNSERGRRNGREKRNRRQRREKAGWEITPILISKSLHLWSTVLMAGVAFAQR